MLFLRAGAGVGQPCAGTATDAADADAGVTLVAGADFRRAADICGLRGRAGETGSGAASGCGSTGCAELCAAPLSKVVATDATPSNKPIAAAATTAQPDRRLNPGVLGVAPRTLVATGESLGGGTEPMLRGAHAAGAESGGGGSVSSRGVTGSGRSNVGSFGIAGIVTLSQAARGAGSLGRGSATGAGGGQLERATGISPVGSALPPRTTTACRGGFFKPGRAMKPPRGVSTAREATGSKSDELSSSCEWVLIGSGSWSA
jgi:hypothetical protein